jgi:glycosyltransferase involved in cell wall biosynthesis
MPGPSESPTIAIIVPLFKHSMLVVDALESALRQKSRYPFIIIVVNDGCPFPESDLQIKSLLAIYPGIIRYVVQNNAGLSAARNTGIDYALSKFPTVQAIYFLDADNRILPGAIEAAYTKLIQEPEISWVYPNIDMFGISRYFDYCGPYSVLRHTRDNICEAGSLVHRRVFDAGVRFDENMKLGYEDWDFWLSAVSHGFRGAHHPYFGFQYRNRAESMLSLSHRDNAEIESYLQRKHAPLLGKRGLMRLESMEAFRYAIVFIDTNEVLLTTGHSEPSLTTSQAEFDELLWRNITVPGMQYIPPFLILMTRVAFDRLSQSGLILWVLHETELTLKDMNISCLIIDPAPADAFEVKNEGRARDSDVIALGRDLVCSLIRDIEGSWIEQILSPNVDMKVSTKTVTVPRQPVFTTIPKGTVVVGLLSRILFWQASPYQLAANRPWVWRELTIPPPHSLYSVVRAAFADEVVYPWPATTRNIGFVLPMAGFGGVDRVAYNLAQQFKEVGWHAHLFVIGQSRIKIPSEFANSFTSINFLNDAAFGGWDPDSDYQGTTLPAARNNPRAINRIVAALAWLDVVVNCHASEFNAAAANLRRLGVKTAAHLHLLDLTAHGRSVGHPLIALAYEHAYDLILCNSQQLLAWMHGAGIPYEKLVHVPNAPGYPVDEARRETSLAERRSPAKRRINALYIGRLDRQKGIDRLAELVQRTRELDLLIDWRIVGSSVSGDCPTPPILQALLEPPVFESEQLISIFGWADVLVLLSDYEGVPLSVLEAQRLGVVVIATNVGALPEIISHGKTGFLVERETAVEETLHLLGYLIGVPALRSRIASTAASQVIEWPEAAGAAICRIEALVAADQKRPAPLASVVNAHTPPLSLSGPSAG